MTLLSDKFEYFVQQRRVTRRERLLARLEAALVATGRTIGRAILDGLEGYAMAHCGRIDDRRGCGLIEQQRRGNLDPAPNYVLEVSSQGRRRIETFDDVEALIRYSRELDA